MVAPVGMLTPWNESCTSSAEITTPTMAPMIVPSVFVKLNRLPPFWAFLAHCVAVSSHIEKVICCLRQAHWGSVRPTS